MNRQEFIQAVSNKASQEVVELVPEAVRMLEQSGHLKKPYLKKDISRVILMAGELRSFGSRDAETTETTSYPTPSDIVNSETIASLVSDEVINIRKLLFSECEPTSPMFKSHSAAGLWIELSAKNEPKMTLATVVLDARELASVYKAADKMLASNSSPTNLMVADIRGYKWEVLSYYDENFAVKRVIISPPARNIESRSELGKLKEGAKRLVTLTGWTEAQAVGNILVGAIPQIPAISLSTNVSMNDITGLSRWVQLNIRGRDITFEELRRVYTDIREQLGLTRKRKVTDRDLLLYELLKSEVPDIWNDGPIAGYKKLQNEWNRTQQNKYKDSKGFDGIRKAIMRLSKKMEIDHLLPS